MKTSKKLLSVLLALVLALSCAAVAFADETTVVASGICGAEGDNLTWDLTTDGLLTIKGTGAMANYFGSGTRPPWMEYYHSRCLAAIQMLGYNSELEFYTALNNGEITEENMMNNPAFVSAAQAIQNLQTAVVVEEGVTAIGSDAFFDWFAKSLTLPSTLEALETRSLERMNLTSLILPEGLERIEEYALAGLKVKELVIPSSVTKIDTLAMLDLFYLESLTFLNDAFDISEVSLACYDHFDVVQTDYPNYEAYREANPQYAVLCNSPINNHYGDDDGLPVVPWLTIKGSCTGAAKEPAEKAHIKFEAIHDWSGWTTVHAATATADGLETRVCSKCSATEENVLPATGVPEEPATEPTTQPTQPSNPQPSGGGSSNPFAGILNAIRSFFETVANFFRNLFR